MKLSLMTYNVRVGVESSPEALADAVRTVGVPDLLALQEIGVRWNMGAHIDQPEYLGAALGLEHRAFAGALTDAQGGQFGVAIVSRWPLRDVCVRQLPQQTDEQRVLLSAVVDAPVPLTVLCTHLSVNESEREAQAAFIAKTIDEIDGPVALLGDLNDRPGTPTVVTAQGAMVDCFSARGEGPEVTFSVADPHRRIDYIFCGGGAVPAGRSWVAREATASDHFPLVARCELRPTKIGAPTV